MWDNTYSKEALSTCLLFFSTEYLIRELQRGQKSFYDDMAAVTLECLKLNEGIDPLDGMSHNQIGIMCDFMGGCRKWAKFFDKRVPCSCLKDNALQQNLVKKRVYIPGGYWD